ncbi:MAG: aminomethyl-transferring glycine dehydrogenase subunit GcvPA [Acidobacteriota bacterium]|nr:aminomethyl-transferring glycine dehydrogenase subunit GcvPA [Blastocatellia bacterium]MDW8411866.1 aminomethyl-transferring glycine dehydrogenase subunit GcvPA [Acidobacteriota bacterium]
MRYVPNSAEERAKMLEEIGVTSIEELFSSIPEHLRLKKLLDLPPARSEAELIIFFKEVAAKNANLVSFLGAGVYNHFRPIIIDTIISRSEFYTTYTPYQPEIAQGTLQAIFEYQTMICQLTGMEVANASMYDGSTALAEALLMAVRITKRRKVLLPQALHPDYRQVVETYMKRGGIVYEYVPFSISGITNADAIAADTSTAAVVIQSPNFFGIIEDISAVAEKAHAAGSLLIAVVTEAISLALLKSPGECGADIVVGEGQSFGVPVGFGGPHVGFFASKTKFQRQMPGRLIGQAYDATGKRGFVITLATREQHIRREKASSNICTNQGLCMLMSTVYLATMGRRGLREVALQNVAKATYAARSIAELQGYKLMFDAPFFNEFVVKTPIPADQIVERLASEGILAGVALGRFYGGLENALLVCVTEQNTRQQIDDLIAGLRHFAEEQ